MSAKKTEIKSSTPTRDGTVIHSASIISLDLSHIPNHEGRSNPVSSASSDSSPNQANDPDEILLEQNWMRIAAMFQKITSDAQKLAIKKINDEANALKIEIMKKKEYLDTMNTTIEAINHTKDRAELEKRKQKLLNNILDKIDHETIAACLKKLQDELESARSKLVMKKFSETDPSDFVELLKIEDMLKTLREMAKKTEKMSQSDRDLCNLLSDLDTKVSSAIKLEHKSLELIEKLESLSVHVSSLQASLKIE